ncbi:MAG TPA: MaoC/PaaZ C-terminal domain-containing protein [Conexibacter sp.]|nr:MaoC/PaaZ C-terminal domain-containing protein [Conexibacter sp.]
MAALTTYARAALPLVPGASLLPFVAGRGKEMPALERALPGVAVDPKQLAEYARVCGFTLRDELPATYLHIKAFPLHMAMMVDGRFPFPAVGLVHLSNRIAVHRPARVSEVFDLVVRTTPIEPHPKGRTFALVSEARVDGELVWEDHSVMLRRGNGSGEPRESDLADRGLVNAAPVTWSLPGDLGRRYGAVSGDRNPIHLHALTARVFGFPRAIAHGMWTKARALAALEGRLPEAYTVDVAFRKPIPLPSRVTFAAENERFVVRSAKNPDTLHLEGTVTP